MDIPDSETLPLLVSSVGWKWSSPDAACEFWIGEDADCQRWLVKMRGAFNGLRERAFSVIAQAVGISCQSSTFLKVTEKCPPFLQSSSQDVFQLAILFMDEHEVGYCSETCPLRELNRRFDRYPYDAETLKELQIDHIKDLPRGEMLGMLCEMHEPPGYFFTRDHSYVQIDNELMFSKNAGGELETSPWLKYNGAINKYGRLEAADLCEKILSLDNEIFEKALQLPEGYQVDMSWNLKEEIHKIQPRAQAFLNARL